MRKLLLIFLLALLAKPHFAISQKVGCDSCYTDVYGMLHVKKLIGLPVISQAKALSYARYFKDSVAVMYIDSASRRVMYMKNGQLGRIMTTFDSSTIGGYIPYSEKGQANGVATLDADGKVPVNQIPAITVSGQVFVDSNMAQMLSHVGATVGTFSIRVDSNAALFVLASTPSSVRTNWEITTGAPYSFQIITDIGATTTHAITAAGLTLTTLANGSSSDTVIVEVNGVLKKVPKSSFSQDIQSVLAKGNVSNDQELVMQDISGNITEMNALKSTWYDNGGDTSEVNAAYITLFDGIGKTQLSPGEVSFGSYLAGTGLLSLATTTTRLAFFPSSKNINVAGLEDSCRSCAFCSNYKADSIARAISVASSGQFIREVVLTSTTTATYTTSSNCHKIFVQINGSGGGGGGATGAVSQVGAASGGQGGMYAEKIFTVTPSTGYSYICGDGGGGGLGSVPNNGSAGGVTQFTVGATVVSVPGGAGGIKKVFAVPPYIIPGGGGAAAPTNADFYTLGAKGAPGFAQGTAAAYSGDGGAPGGGSGASGTADGGSASGPSGGGAGGLTLGAATSNGGKGGKAVIRVFEYN